MRTTKQTILVVDNDRETRGTLVSALLPLGCLIVEVEDGEQGYDRFVREGADLVVLADCLPSWSGVEMAGKIREADSRVPILLLRWNGSDDLEEEAMRLGNCRVLTRPFYPRQFRTVVEAALAHRGAETAGGSSKRR